MAQGGYFGWIGGLFGGQGLAWRLRQRPRVGRRRGWRGLFGRQSDDRLAPTIINSPAVARPFRAPARVRRGDLVAANTLARIKRMRRRAVVDMFDQVGLEPFPGQLWRFVDAERDPYHGVTSFLQAIGIDPEGIRRRDPGEIERANTVLDLLFSIDHVFDRVDPEVAVALEARLCSGDYRAVRLAAQVIETFEKIARIDARWPPDHRLAVLDAFIADMRAGAANPLAVPAEIAANAERIADELNQHMLAFDAGWAEHRRLAALLDARWPPGWSAAPQGQRRARAMAEATVIQCELTGNPALGASDVDRLLERLANANQSLFTLADVIEGASRGGDWRARAVGPQSDYDRALLFFGWTTDARPDAVALRRRFRELARSAHPDTAKADPAAQAAAHQRFVELNRYHDVLKLRV